MGRPHRFARRLRRRHGRPAPSGTHHHQAPREPRGRAPRRRLEDRVRRFHDGDDGVLPRAVDHQRHRQEHQDHHRAIFQPGEVGGVGADAQEHPRRRHRGAHRRRSGRQAQSRDRRRRATTARRHDGDAPRRKAATARTNKGADQSARQGNGATAEAADPANPKPTMSEGALFTDPYRSLDAIAGPSSPNARAIAQSDKRRMRASGIGRPRRVSRPVPADRPRIARTVDRRRTHRRGDRRRGGQPPPAERRRAVAAPPPRAGGAKPQSAAPSRRSRSPAAAARLQKELELQLGALGTDAARPRHRRQGDRRGAAHQPDRQPELRACSRSARRSLSPRWCGRWTRSPAA